MEFQKPYIRRSQSNDLHSSPGGSQEGDSRPARGRGPNGEGSSGWNHSADQRYRELSNGHARSADEDWFEGRVAQQMRMKSPKGPIRKAGWNQWVSPSLRDTKATSAARMADSGDQSGTNSTSPTIADDVGGRSPPVHPDRRVFTKTQSFNGGRGISHEASAHPEPGPPAAPREDDATMTEWSGDFAPLEGRRKSTDTQDSRPGLPRKSSPITDPRRLSRLGNRPPQVLQGFSTGRASPYSEASLDSGKHSLTERERNYGQRFVPQGPKIPPTTPTPRIASHSLPPRPPLPPPPSMSRPSDTTVQMERLLAVLGDFTDHVSSMASIHVQRDNAKKHLARQENEFVKWRKQHLSFPPLAEQQEKSRATAQKEFEDLDKKLKQHIKSRDQLAKAIAMSVISNQSDGGSESERVNFLEEELEATRSEVQKLRAEVNRASSEHGQIQDVRRDSTKCQKRIADMEFELDKLLATSTRPPVASSSENSNSNLDKTLSKLQEKLSMLQDRVDDIPNLKLDLSKSKQEVRDLNSLVNVQADSLQELKGTANGQVDSLKELEGTVAELRDTVVALKGTVVGEGDDKGLIDVVANVEEDLDKYRAAMTKMNEELNGFQDELHKIGGRISAGERGTSRRQTPQLATTTTKYDDSEIRSGLESIKTEMAEFKSDLATVRREQDEKDELVAADIDAINNSASKLDETVHTNRTDVEAAISRINASISTLQARAVTPVTSSHPPTAIPLANGTGKLDDAVSKKFQDTLKQHRTALENLWNNIAALERGYQHLDDRFNNLTTDQLARNMVHQMSEMYPHAANVQAELDLVKNRHEQLRQNFTGLFTKVAQLEKFVFDTQSSTISKEQVHDLQKRLDTLTEEVKIIRSNTNTEHEAINNRINSIDLKIHVQNPQLREGISSLRTEVGALSAHLDDWGNQTLTDLGNVGLQVEQLNEHCGLVFDKPNGSGARIATMKEKLAMQHKPATSAADDDGVTGTPTVAAAVSSASTVDVEADDEDVLPTGMRMRRTYLKTKKRRRVEGSDEETEELQGKGEGRSGE